MRITALAITLALQATLATRAEGQQLPSPDDRYRALVGRGVSSLIKGGAVAPYWLGGGDAFWYTETVGDSSATWKVDPATNKRTPFVAPVVAPADRDRSTPRLVRRSFPETAPDLYEIPSPDGRSFLGERDRNIWLRSSADGSERALTTDGVAERPWTIRATQALSPSGSPWSHDGSRVVVMRLDHRGVANVPVVHWLEPIETVDFRPFPKAGGVMSQSELWLLDLRTGRQVKLDTGNERDATLHLLDWTTDDAEVLIVRGDRTLQHVDLLAADPATGKTRLVLGERQRTFIKGIAYPGWANLVTVLPKTKHFVVMSERDGWDHLYLYDWQGRLVRRLTSGTWPVLSVEAVDEERGWVYFSGHDDVARPYDTHLYRVGLDGRGFTRLTDAPGRHRAQFSPSRRYYLDTHSAIDRPPVTELRTAEGKLLQVLSRADVSRLLALGWKVPEEFRVKAADDTTDLYGVIHKPFDFDPARKYPVVVYLYGGPQMVLAPHGFPASYDDARSIALAQLGFIVVTLDPRGTPERGKAFQDWVYGNWGRHVIPDHVAALKQLTATRPFMDTSRVGIFGLSWGGYYTLRAMVQAPEVFHVGVAIAPVADLDDHGAFPIEPYMGLPKDNRAAYDYASNLELADRVRGKLLMMHGTSDVNATFSATMKMVDALTEAGKPYDLIVVPEMNHGPGATRIRYFEDAIRRYLVGQLHPGAGDSK